MDIQFLKQTYTGKKVLLTGHTGFKGSWMLQWLHALGADVMGYALPPQTEQDLYTLIDGDELCTSVIADIRDTAQVHKAVSEFQPDFVFHLAAQPLVKLSYEIPVDTFAINAMGTANILEAVRRLEKKCVVVLITTDKVYENKEWIYPYRETDRLGGYDPYSASKACAEVIIHAYTQSFFNVKEYALHQKAIASARAGNVIGGGDWSANRIVPDIVRALDAGQPVTVRNPGAVRPWQHVLEPVGGYLLLGANLAKVPLEFGGAWNFGPLADDNRRVEDLVQTALKAWGQGSYNMPILTHQPHEAGLLKLDISKAIAQLGWTPLYNSQAAIQHTISWYKAFCGRETDMKQFTLNQIYDYTGQLTALPKERPEAAGTTA